MKVYIVGGDHLIERMFLSRGWEVVEGITDADLVCFTGGADVTPSLYGERNVASHCDWLRDAREVEEYKIALDFNLPMVGICRGGQFLNVMNGGKMWQDVNNHAIGGTHILRLLPGIDDYRVTSTHHQMMRKGDGGSVIGIAELSTRFIHDGDDPAPDFDTEIVWYPDTRTLCFQPHPEYNGSRDGTEALFFSLLEQYLRF